MEGIPIGYKKSKLGLIPLEWEFDRFDKILNLRNGDSKTSADIILNHGEIPVYGGNGITGFTNSLNVDSKSIIVGRVGEYCGSIHKSDTGCWVTDNAMYITNFAKISFEFCYFLLKYKKLNKFKNIGGQPLISKKAIGFVLLQIPPLPEQLKIAAILSSVDRAIDKTQVVIAKTERLKKGLMQLLLTRGVPGWHSEWKESKLGEIPGCWEVKELNELGTVKGGKRLPKGSKFSSENTNYRYLRILDVKKNKNIDLEKMKSLSMNVFEKLKRYEITFDDLYITIVGTGTIGYTGRIPKTNIRIILTENAAKIIIKDFTVSNIDFLIRLLRSPIIQKQVDKIISVQAQPKLALYKIEKLKMPLPRLNEQKKINDVFKIIDSNLQTFKSDLIKLKQIKKALLQQLLTGKIRV